MYSAPIAPPRKKNKKNITEENKYRKTVDRTSPLTVIADLDYDAALEHHVLCGFPHDEDVHDPAYVLERYRKAGGVFGTQNYPDLNIENRKRVNDQQWSPTGSNPARRAALASAYKKHNVLRESSNSNSSGGVYCGGVDRIRMSRN